MKIKRYVVREMQEAIRLIKQDLGPEAVIVSSYKVTAKGLVGLFSPRLLEVTAALDDTHDVQLRVDCPPAQMAVGAGNFYDRQSSLSMGPVRALPGKIARYLTAAGTDSKNAGGLMPSGEVLSEEATTAEPRMPVHKTQKHLMEKERCLFDMMVEQVESKDPVQIWRHTLLGLDIQGKIVEEIIAALDREQTPMDDNHYVYSNLLKEVTRLLEPCRSGERPRVMAFVGPSGVGKTTTLAKLATRYSLNQHKKVAMVAVYTYRIGAVEQLQAYGDFLGIPVEVVMTPAELAKVLENHTDKDYIFIDTAGRSPGNEGQLLELKCFLDVIEEPRDVFLVLNSTMREKCLSRAASEFRKVGYSELVFTKIDEAETHGSILNISCAFGVPVAFLANGQGVPDDIREASPKKITKLLFRGVDPDEVMAF